MARKRTGRPISSESPSAPTTTTHGAAFELLRILLASRRAGWFYWGGMGFLVLAGLLLSWVAGVKFEAVFLFHDPRQDIGTAVIYAVIALLLLVLAVGLLRARRFFLEEVEREERERMRLSTLREQDFDDYERQRVDRERKARVDFENNLRTIVVAERMTMKNVTMFPDLSWSLQPRVNVLLGRNGFGKSFLLRSLVGMLQGDTEATDTLFDVSSESQERQSVFLDVLQDGERRPIRRNSFRFSDSLGKIPVLAIPDSRFFDRSQVTIGPGDGTTLDLRADGAEHFLRQVPYGSVLHELLYEICLDYWEGGQSFDRPVFAFYRDCVRRLTNSDFQFKAITRVGRSGFDIRVITDGNPHPLPIQAASQGTLSVLAMFGLIRSYLLSLANGDDSAIANTPAIVAIDEADAHLHPLWQQKFPTTLKDLFPRVQFLLTAHSPLFVAGCWRGEAAVLRRADSKQPWKGFTVQQLDRDFVGATAAELYAEVFDIEQMDDTFLEYSTKATTRRSDVSSRINVLVDKRAVGALSAEESRELDTLTEESRRIRRVVEVRDQRGEETALLHRIATLESENLQLRSMTTGLSKESQR